MDDGLGVGHIPRKILIVCSFVKGGSKINYVPSIFSSELKGNRHRGFFQSAFNFIICWKKYSLWICIQQKVICWRAWNSITTSCLLAVYVQSHFFPLSSNLCIEIILKRFIFVQSFAVRNLIWFEKYPEYSNTPIYMYHTKVHYYTYCTYLPIYSIYTNT